VGEKGHRGREDVIQTDGSLHQPLSIKRTNYHQSDSRVITTNQHRSTPLADAVSPAPVNRGKPLREGEKITKSAKKRERSSPLEMDVPVGGRLKSITLQLSLPLLCLTLLLFSALHKAHSLLFLSPD